MRHDSEPRASSSRLRPPRVPTLVLVGALLGIVSGPGTAYEYDPVGRLISVTYDPVSAVLTVTGTERKDLIFVGVSEDGVILVNGRDRIADGVLPTLSNTALVQIEGHGGDDILIGGLLPVVAMNGGRGASSLGFYTDEGLLIALISEERTGRNSGPGWLVGGTAVAGLLDERGVDLLPTASSITLRSDPTILVRDPTRTDEDVFIDGQVVPVDDDALDDDGDLDLYLVNAPGGDNADGDGDLDIYVTNGPGGPSADDDLDLYLVNAPGGDNAGEDGDLDLYVTNGPGTAAVDLDGDGDPDVSVLHGLLRSAPCPSTPAPRSRPDASCLN